MRTVVVALGDLGRSARMQYRAHARAAQGVDVELVGFEGTPLPRAIADEPRIAVHRLSPSTLRRRTGRVGLAYAVIALFDAARTGFRLWRTLRKLKRPDLVLTQNPPAFPTLVVTWFSLRRKGVRFVIDWHNLGFTLLRLRLGRWHPAGRLGPWVERRDARRVEANPGVSRRFTDLVILVTGDGARRAEFERRFAGLPARRIQLRARWLEPEDYPRVVGSADLGLCLHRSSSGLDIPMKVADLFGAGVPVCALDYGACLAERVRHGDNGLLFSTARQLADVIFDLFEAFPGNQSSLDRLRTGARRSARPTWEEGWSRDAKPVLLPDGQP